MKIREAEWIEVTCLDKDKPRKYYKCSHCGHTQVCSTTECSKCGSWMKDE